MGQPTCEGNNLRSKWDEAPSEMHFFGGVNELSFAHPRPFNPMITASESFVSLHEVTQLQQLQELEPRCVVSVCFYFFSVGDF